MSVCLCVCFYVLFTKSPSTLIFESSWFQLNVTKVGYVYLIAILPATVHVFSHFHVIHVCKNRTKRAIKNSMFFFLALLCPPFNINLNAQLAQFSYLLHSLNTPNCSELHSTGAFLYLNKFGFSVLLLQPSSSFN